MQPFTGRDDSGRLLPQTWDDVNDQYPKLFDPSKYIDHYDEYLKNCEDANYSENHYREEWVRCTTSRFLIGPDNMVYPCHRHLYAGDLRYACGTILDPDIRRFKYKWNRLLGRWVVHCDTKCNPCDFMVVKIKHTGEPTQVVPGLPWSGVAPAGVATTQASPK